MRIDELTVEVRDASLARVGQILPKDLVGFKAVLRFNNVGSWEITLPNGHDVGDVLRLPGSGIVVTGPNGVILSGPTTGATNTKTADNPNGDWLIQGVDDSIVLGERLAYPQPSNSDVATQTATHDTRLGLASTAMYGYVNANIGPSAPTARKISNLTLAADTGLGSYVYPAARFDVLGELLAGIAAIDGLGFDIKQVNGTLEFSVFQPVDRSSYIRMDVANNTLSKTEYAYGSHALSRAIVAGGGEGLNRTFVEVTSTESLAAETAWGRRIESFIDKRDTTDGNELTQAGNEKLADGGATLTSVDVVPSSDLTMAYGSDWDLGDVVTVVVDNQEVAATVTTVSMSIGSDGVRVGATVGQPTGVDFQSVTARKSTDTAQRVNALERKDAPAISWNDTEGTYEFTLKGGNVTLQIGQEQVAYVKNNTGATLLNGSAVYPNGSTGTNNLVSLAKADAEATSTKTFGVLTEDIANGQHGFVTTFGMVHDINTSALTEGASVWLSPTVAGGLTSTKPSAPNHMVLIGFCVRSHAVNGSIFVKVQNGFELDELHDVAISGVAAGDLLVRNAGNTAWANSTVAAAGIATTTALNLKAPIASPTFTGTVTAPTLSVTANGTVGGNLTVTGETYLNGTEIQGDGKTMLRYSDTWLRINEDNEFTSGIYAGTGLFRTDGNFQVGVSGATLNVSGSTFTYNNRPVMGLTPAIPTSVTVGSGSASVSATGLVTFSGVSSVSLNGVFSSTYKNYRMVASDLNSAAGNASFCLRLRSGTTDNATSNYYQYWNMKRLNGAVQDNSGGPNTYYATVGFDANTSYSWSWTGDIVSPFATRNTTVTGLGFGADATSTYNVTSTVLHTVATSFNGITFFPTSSTLSGTVQIYGYN